MESEALRDARAAVEAVENGKIRSGKRDLSREEIRALRQRLGFSQPEFAVFMNVSVDTVRSWEKGRRRPGNDAVETMRNSVRPARAPSWSAPSATMIVAIREGLELSQDAFALRYGLDPMLLMRWEAGVSKPAPAEAQLLWMIQADAEAALDLVKRARVLAPV